jgi:hypothetical protein
MLKPHPLDDYPTLDDLFNFLAQYPRAQRKALRAVVRRGEQFFPIHDIRQSGASLTKGTFQLVSDPDMTIRQQMDDPTEPSTPCFLIG